MSTLTAEQSPISIEFAQIFMRSTLEGAVLSFLARELLSMTANDRDKKLDMLRRELMDRCGQTDGERAFALFQRIISLTALKESMR